MPLAVRHQRGHAKSLSVRDSGQPLDVTMRLSAVKGVTGIGLLLLASACAGGSSAGVTLGPSSAKSSTPTADPTLVSGRPPGPFLGRWIGHTRMLKITAAGTGSELVDGGCCQLVYDITFRLTQVSGDRSRARARFIVTSARLGSPRFFDHAHPAPRVGDSGALRLRDGVVTDLLMGSNFCDRRADDAGTCGL